MHIIIKIHMKAMFMVFGILFAAAIALFAIWIFKDASPAMLAGGSICSSPHTKTNALAVANLQDDDESERFQRPSKNLPLSNPYTFEDFAKTNDTPIRTFETPDDLALAYYAILQNASNMLGYSGGCGTIGQSSLPYPYAYALFTKEKQKQMSLQQFVDSFAGIGHTTLLQLVSAYSPPDTPDYIQYYMIEIEVITGAKAKNEQEYHQGSQFAYYYGLLTAEKTANDGWKIKDIQYIPEDFLCAPTHNWFYLSDAVVQIVYGDNLKIIEKLDKTEQKGNRVYIYASGNGKHYRFDFIRLTNGYDILLYENIFEGGIWKETQLPTGEWNHFKLTIENAQL